MRVYRQYEHILIEFFYGLAVHFTNQIIFLVLAVAVESPFTGFGLPPQLRLVDHLFFRHIRLSWKANIHEMTAQSSRHIDVMLRFIPVEIDKYNFGTGDFIVGKFLLIARLADILLVCGITFLSSFLLEVHLGYDVVVDSYHQGVDGQRQQLGPRHHSKQSGGGL